MADVSDPEDEIVDIGPRVVDLGPDPPMQPPAQPACSGDHGPHGHSHAPGAQAHGHSHGPARGARAPVKAPPGSDRWPAVYPLYINKLRTRQQGRRVGKEDAVANPAFWEIRDVLKDAGFQIWIENKVHPREPDRFLPLGPAPMGNPHRGRIKFKLCDENKKPCVAKFPTKVDVYKYLGQMIPKLKQRIEGTKMMEQHMAMQQNEQERPPSQAGSTAKPTAKPTTNKKTQKNKKAKKGKR